VVKDKKYGLGLLVSGFVGIISSVPRYMLNPNQPNLTESTYLFVASFMFCIISWSLNFSLLDFKSTQLNTKKRNLTSTILRMFLSTAITLILAYLLAIILFDVIDKRPLLDRYQSFSQLAIWACFRFSLINGFVMVLKYTIDTNNEKKDIKIAHERLKKENITAQYEALKQQLNPHFLFNSLSSLSSMIKQDHEASAEFVMRLSHVYRYLLTHNKENVVALEQEMNFIEAYLFLLRSRFGQNLNVFVAIPEQCQKQYGIPALSIQLLIENAIKHNIISFNKPLTIKIEVIADELLVSNNIQLRKNLAVEESNGIGLGSINRRYELLVNKNIEVVNASEQFIVKLPLIKII